MLPTFLKIVGDLVSHTYLWLPATLALGVAWVVSRRWRKATATVGLVALLVGVSLYRPELDRFHADTRVYHSAGRGDVRGLQAALDEGGSPNADDPTSGGWPALSAAVESGNASCVEILLQRGADPDSKSWGCGTVLHEARKMNRPDLVRLLERYGSRLDQPGD